MHVPAVLQPPHKVDLNNAEKTVLVELLKTCAAMSVYAPLTLLGLWGHYGCLWVSVRGLSVPFVFIRQNLSESSGPRRVSDYKQLSKFNLRELSSVDDEQVAAAKADAAAKKAKTAAVPEQAPAEAPAANAAVDTDGGAAAEPPAEAAAAAEQQPVEAAALNGHAQPAEAAAGVTAKEDGGEPFGCGNEGVRGKSGSLSSDVRGTAGHGAAIAGGGDEDDEVSDAAA